MDAIDKKIREVSKQLEEYEKAIHIFTVLYPVQNPLGYTVEPTFALGSKEDIVVDALEAYKYMLKLRTDNMNSLAAQIRIRGDTTAGNT